MEKISGLVVVNPTAGNGLIRRGLPALERQLAAVDGWRLAVANQEAELPDLVADVRRFEIPRIVVVGGDGTNHKLFTAMRKVGRDAFLQRTEFAFTNGGTMNFLARSLNTADTPLQHLVRVLADRVEKRSVQLLRFDGAAAYPLIGTFAGFAAAAAVLAKYHQTAGGRFRIMQWIARGTMAALAPVVSPEIASLLAPIPCTVDIDGKRVLSNPLGMLVSAIPEFKLRFPFVPPVRPFRQPIGDSQFGVIASNHTPRELASGLRQLWQGQWPATDERVVNTLASGVVISGHPGAVNVDGDEYYSQGDVRVSLGPRIRVLI